MREKNLHISNKSFVVMKYSLLVAVLIGLVAFTVFNILPVYADGEICIETIAKCSKVYIYVKELGTNTPIENANVNLVGSSVYNNNTDSSGLAFFQNIDTGTYNATASKSGYCDNSTIFSCATCSTTNIIIYLKSCPPTECTPGETRPCPSPDQGCEGTQTCEQNGFWGPCSSQGTECSRTTYCDNAPTCNGHAMYAVCDENAQCGDETNTDDTDDSGCAGQICGLCPGSDGFDDCHYDEYDYTQDSYVSGNKMCSAEGTCSIETCEYVHKCADNDTYDGGGTVGCYAQCDENSDCPDRECVGTTIREYYCDLWSSFFTVSYIPTCSCKHNDYPCDDGISCTIDSCDSETVECIHTPDDSLCDDGQWCNGKETCDVKLGCKQGIAPNCDDEDPCTTDACDEVNDRCVHTHLDVNPPVTTKTYGTPIFEDEIYDWITSDTPITLTPIDYGIDQTECAKEVNKTFYRYCLNPGCYDGGYDIAIILPTCECPEGTPWLEYTGTPFKIPEDSEHCIQYYSEDKLIDEGIIDGVNVEPIKSQCVYVDNTPPEPDKKVGDPRDEWTPGENGDPESIFYPEANYNCWKGEGWECWKVTLLTSIKLDCVDPEPHPVDHEKVCFYAEVDAEDKTDYYCSELYGPDASIVYDEEYGKNFCCLDREKSKDFYFMEETEHELEYYCVDKLGNKGDLDIEKFKVLGTNFEIQLNKKYNLISIPFVLLNDDPQKVFEGGIVGDLDNVDSVWTYDPEHIVCDSTDEQGWCVYTLDERPDTLNHIIPGWGYWVIMYRNDTLLIGGSLFTPIETPPSRHLEYDWNLIGYYGIEGAPEPSGIPGYYGPYGNGDYSKCALSSIYPDWSYLLTYWNQFSNPWVDRTGGCQKLDPGAGYWILIKENGKTIYGPGGCIDDPNCSE